VRDPTLNSNVEETIEEARAFLDQRREYLQPFDDERATYIDRINVARRDVEQLPDQVMPRHTREFIAGILTMAKDHLPRKRGRYAKGLYDLRDLTIVKAVDYIAKRGDFFPTRNPETKTNESACSIVRTALERNGMHLSERTVEDIWNNRSVRTNSPK
jgi:hypothetical protein